MNNNYSEDRVTLADGRTTDPVGRKAWYVGNELDKITFDFLMLPDGEVAVHSHLNATTLDIVEDFLYEIWPRDEIMECATTMVQDAGEYLLEHGLELDNNPGVQEFLARLQQELSGGLH